MHHRILKLLGTHVHHDEVACTSKVKAMVKGKNEYCLIGLPIGRSVGSQGAVLAVFIIFSDSSSFSYFISFIVCSYFCQDVFKVVCYICVVCGNGLKA